MTKNDIGGAYKTLELASRQDAGNPDIERLMGIVRPKYEAAEKARKSGLSANEMMKEKGDEQYKAANFEGAIEFYTKCLDQTPDKACALAIKAYSNR